MQISQKLNISIYEFIVRQIVKNFKSLNPRIEKKVKIFKFTFYNYPFVLHFAVIIRLLFGQSPEDFGRVEVIILFDNGDSGVA